MMKWFTSKNQNESALILQPSKYISQVQMDLSTNPQLHKQIQLLQLTTEDLAVIRQLQPYTETLIPTMVEKFYDSISLSEELTTIINKTSRINKLKVTLTKHLTDLFKCHIDDSYIDERKVIAKVHVRIGLRSKWYIASFQSLVNTFSDFVAQLPLSKMDSLHVINAFNKLINLEQQLVIEEYELEEQRIRDKIEQLRLSLINQINLTAEELNAISEQTSASLYEIASQSDVIATNTNEGLQFATSTEEKSMHGRKELNNQTFLMNTVIDRLQSLEVSMGNLRDSSKKITDIVGLVTGIADQTNLLALNASIEAARAGEHGKGFAVVAEEVRKLAEETKNAVQNVSSLIRDTETSIETMADSVTNVDLHVKNSVETQLSLEQSFEEIIEAISSIKERYVSTSKDISSISQVINELSQATSQVAHSSDSLVRVVHELSE